MSSPSLTVARARTHLAQHVLNPTDNFVRKINEGASRVSEMGKWVRSSFTQELPVYDGYLVLPRRAAAMLGYASAIGRPRTTYPLVHEYSEVGPGDTDASLPMRGAVEQPDVCVFRQPAAPSVLSVQGIAGDAGKTIRIHGLLANGDIVFDDADGSPGELITMHASGSVNTTKTFAAVTYVERQATKAYVNLKAGATILGRYEPGEMEPNYRCYKVGTPPNDDAFKVLCSRRHVDVVGENDHIFPPHIGALKNALLGCLMEDAHDPTTAAQHFDEAFKLLNLVNAQRSGGVAPSPPRVIGWQPISTHL